MAIHTRFQTRAKLNGLSLCSGFGGLELGLQIAEPGYTGICYIERESSAAATLVARMEDTSLDNAPIWDDVTSFNGKPWRGKVHIITGGYPCQPFSQSGKRRGSHDPRHLWPDIERIIGEVRPDAVFFENVKGHLDLGFPEVAKSLQAMGFAVKAGIFSAAEVGASQIRERLFILGYTNRVHDWELGGVLAGAGRSENTCDRTAHGKSNDFAPANKIMDSDDDVSKVVRRVAQPDRQCHAPLFPPAPDRLSGWQKLLTQHPQLQPAISRTSDGMADWMERCTGAGNGVCPLAAAHAWTTLMGDVLG